MITRKVKIVNRLGLHARPSALLVTIASRYQSSVFLQRDDLKVNGKSIMGVMMLAAEKGAQITFEVDGPDEEKAMEALVEVVMSGFGEEN
ncbi:MAG: HPr family phosphocarrier protein [bacterium]